MMTSESLPRRHREILQSMTGLRALSFETRVASPAIIEEIDLAVCIKSFCCVFADLSRMGLVMAKRGSDGGYWLTVAGSRRGAAL
jgi:DNA-binding IscR family transcriptional regulator